ncbi:MAG: putative archaetidylserine decarboxylase proenzyme [Candidatus Woesearchaeota archaeon]|nr:putative archaetidylserine decarboxylase proenzyme [Candidatus Woesearchaeota archaeon]
MILDWILGIIFILIIIILLFYKLIFLRDPEIKIPCGKNLISPADGKIVTVLKLNDDKTKISKGMFGKVKTLTRDVEGGYLLSIFMNLLSIHVNRSPLSGKVISVKHSKGNFYRAFEPEKSLTNEKTETVIQTKIGRVKIIQISGFLIRRIQNYLKINQDIAKGQRIGRIVFGSQVSLIIPKNVKIKVKVGDKVKVGQTILAEY